MGTVNLETRIEEGGNKKAKFLKVFHTAFLLFSQVHYELSLCIYFFLKLKMLFSLLTIDPSMSSSTSPFPENLSGGPYHFFPPCHKQRMRHSFSVPYYSIKKFHLIVELCIPMAIDLLSHIELWTGSGPTFLSLFFLNTLC